MREPLRESPPAIPCVGRANCHLPDAGGAMSKPRDRPTARVLLLDSAGRLLLFRFEPGNQPPLWATPGGGLEPGEDFPEGARRELREETGLDLDCGTEVACRIVEFVTPDGETVVADERYFRS